MSIFVSEQYVEEDITLRPSEVRTLKLLARGLNHHEIAEELGRSVETIKDHSRNARAKLGARNTTHAVALAMSYDLI